MSTQTSYPIFEDNQVLTSSQLNGMRLYLDEQNRLTRTKLIGIGVADGLEISYNPRSTSRAIVIHCGTGVTSAGYLITLGECSLDRLRPYTLPLGSVYAPFMDTTDPLQPQLPMYELLTNATPVGAGVELLQDITVADPAFLDTKAVLLFIELADIDNDSCLGRKCDENGISRMFTLRKLLVDIADLDIIIENSQGDLPDPMNESKYGLPVFTMRRPLFAPDEVNSQNYLDFSKNYVNAFSNDIFINLFAELNNTYLAYQGLLEPVYGVNPFQNISVLDKIAAWTNYLNGVQVNAAPPYFGIQYFYDFMKDLILAYDEFCEVAFNIASECCINMTRFERHLMLGEVIPSSTCGPTPYRQEFIFSRVQEGQRLLFDKAIMLHKRIMLLIHSFEFELISDPDPDLVLEFITPSFEKRSFLSDRAIPYYYDANNGFQFTGGSEDPYYILSQNWNFGLNQKCRTVNGITQILAYDNQSSNRFVDQGPVKTPLFYSLDPYNFLRIEGHLRKNYVDVVEELEDLKNRFDLPFNIVALRLQGTAFDVVEDRCNFEDLRSQYSVLRSSFMCNANFICNLVTKQVNPGPFMTNVYADMNAGVGNTSVAFNPSVPTVISIGASLSPELLAELDTSFPGILPVLNSTPFVAANSSGAIEARKAFDESAVVGRTVDGKEVAVSTAELFTVNDPLNVHVDVGTVIIDRSSPLEILTNDYMRFMNDLCTKLTLLTDEDLLPFDFKSFNFGADITTPAESFIKTYNEAMSLAISSKVALNKIEDFILRNTRTRPTPELYYLLSRYFGEVYDVLNTFILSCAYKEFEMLYYTYRYRVNWLRDNDPTLFSNFIKKHPGVNHKAGVEPGGTFVVVYNGDNVTIDVQTVEEAILIAQTQENLLCQEAALLDLPTRSPQQSLQLEFIQSRLALCYSVQDALANNVPIAIQQIQLEAHEVIADFALPYLCCCDCDCSSIPAPSLDELNLPTYPMPVFVEYNMGDYAFGTTLTNSMEGCKTTVGFITIDVKSRVIYDKTAGTSFRLKIVQNGAARTYDLTPDAQGVLDAITTSNGGLLQVVTTTSGAVFNRQHSFKYRPAQNFVGAEEINYIFETYDRFGKKLASTPGKLYIHVTCDCTVVPISQQQATPEPEATA